MRSIILICIFLGVPSLACGVFSKLPGQSPPTTATIRATPTPIRAFSITRTATPPPDLTPSETSLPASETLTPTASLTPPPSPSPTLTPFPTILPLACLPSPATSEFGQVKWVVDGGSIMVDIQGKLSIIHYLGVQSPINLPFIQYFGPPAATQNAAFVQGQIVQLIPDVDGSSPASQNARYVLIYNTQTFVNFEMLRLGLAQFDPNTDGLACANTFMQIQEQARLSQVGLWAPSPTLFPSATLRPSKTPTATLTRPPTSAYSPTPSTTAFTTTPTPSATHTATSGSSTPSPSATTGSPTLTETPGQPPGQSSTTPTPNGVGIINISNRGTAPNENDEYVEIKNFSASTVNLLTWWVAEENEYHYFVFSQVNLGAGQTCRVYTNQSSGVNWCGNFESATPIWDNASDCGVLYNSDDEEISRYCYP